MDRHEHVLVIDKEGTVKTLYTDLVDLRDFGPLHVERASNVEWDDKRQGWIVQFNSTLYLSIPERGWCCGTHAIAGVVPEVFESREDALAAEVDYLQARM
jgi:hypothetical protein